MRAASLGSVALLLLAAALLLGIGLTGRPLQNVDEGIHAAVSLESLQNGEWLVPTVAGEPYYRKPPLKLWMSSGLMAVLGTDLWSVRLPSLLAGILCALLLARWTLEFSGSFWQAGITGLCFASMRPTFFHSFRSGEMDGLLTLCVTASLYCWWRARRGGAGRLWPALLGVAMGLGFLFKAAPALLPLLVIAGDAVWTRRRPSARAAGIAAAAFLVVALPWHLVVTIVHGAPFWEHYVGVEVLERVQRPLHTGDKGTWFYFGLLPVFLFPLSVALLPGVVVGARDAARGDGERADTLRVLLLWLGLGLLAVSMMQSKASWYVVPMMPAAVALAIDFLVRARPLAGDAVATAGHAALVWGTLALLPGVFLDADGLAEWRSAGAWTHPVIFASLGTAAVCVLALWLRRLWQPVLLGRLVLGGVLLAQAGVWAIEVRRSHPENPLAPLARDLGELREPVELVSVAPLHWLDPAGYFHLLAAPSVSVRIVDGWKGLAPPGDGPRFVLAPAEGAPPAHLAQRLEPVGTYAEYRLLRER